MTEDPLTREADALEALEREIAAFARRLRWVTWGTLIVAAVLGVVALTWGTPIVAAVLGVVALTWGALIVTLTL